MNFEAIPPELLPVIERFNREVLALMARLQNGLIMPDEWYDEFRRMLARYSIQAMQAGTGLKQLPPGSLELLQKNLNFQDEYLDNFRMVIESAGDFNPAWISRAQMYVNSVQVPYWEGSIFQQAGRFLPVPFVPGQGTQCMSRDRCTIKINTIDGNNGDFDMEWLLDPNITDHCQTCLERAAMSPYRIRGGDLQL